MRILLLAHSFNGLTQRLYVELAECGHELSVELDINDAVMREAVELFRPDIVLAPFLKRAIPEDIWRGRRCLIVHPGSWVIAVPPRWTGLCSMAKPSGG